MSSTTTPRPPRPLPVRPSHAAASSVAPDEGGWDLLCSLRDDVVAFLCRRCRDRHQAEDLAHDTLLRAARYRSSLARVARPRSWALQIAVNVHRDHARKEARQQLTPPDHASFLELPGTEPVPGEPDPAETYAVDGRVVDGDDLVREVRAAWPELLPQDRAALGSYYVEGGTTRAAAAACGVSPDLVKVRLFRARRRLEAAVRERLART